MLKKIVFAGTFGASYFLLTLLIPFGYRFTGLYCDCTEPGSLFWKDQAVLAACAALSFYFSNSLKATGWRWFLKAAGTTYLCFQIYSIVAIHDLIFIQQCYYPAGLAEIPKTDIVRFLVAGLFVDLYWSAIGVLLMALFNRVFLCPTGNADDMPAAFKFK